MIFSLLKACDWLLLNEEYKPMLWGKKTLTFSDKEFFIVMRRGDCDLLELGGVAS